LFLFVCVEGVRTFDWNGWQADALVRSRHTEFSSGSSTLAFGVFTTGNFVYRTLQSRCEFEASGAARGVALHHQIGLVRV
jgi:hypothetical protein